ncbi:unnamed protein product [Bemisia tabaci]|uniref:c-Myc-binding protein n=1 Tax=Bemisia tabaci TaxID=7038 RepID=A0A9P0F1V4_BEMTA|nr:PREDICTED: C-Myc-binding protein [Bemisia tabaci]CAH0385390.1 unnamed protein product [Bemisia tabaci]
MTSSFRPVDSKREEFRKYVERNGIMGALTRALTMLYEEQDKPECGLEYIRNILNEVPHADELQPLRNEVDHLKHKLILIESQRDRLLDRLLKYEPDAASIIHNSSKSKSEK